MIIRLSDNGYIETNRQGGSIIKLPDERYEEIKQIVVKLFVDYGVSCVPVNGFELAAKMGITVVPYSASVGLSMICDKPTQFRRRHCSISATMLFNFSGRGVQLWRRRQS